jgi:hypothetical protein
VFRFSGHTSHSSFNDQFHVVAAFSMHTSILASVRQIKANQFPQHEDTPWWMRRHRPTKAIHQWDASNVSLISPLARPRQMAAYLRPNSVRHDLCSSALVAQISLFDTFLLVFLVFGMKAAALGIEWLKTAIVAVLNR